MDISVFCGGIYFFFLKDYSCPFYGIGDLTIADLVHCQFLLTGRSDHIPCQKDHDQEKHYGSDIKM